MSGSYLVLVLDADGCELSNSEENTLTAAKALARDRIAEREYLDAGAVKAEVRNAQGRNVYDVFAHGSSSEVRS